MTKSNNQFKEFETFTTEATDAGKEQMEALVQSGNIAVKGFESIFKSYMSLAQSATEKNTQAFKTLMGCKTLDELKEAQSGLAQQGNLDEWISDTTKLSEQCVKVMTEAFEPLNSQVNKAVKKAGESVAA